MTSVGRTEPTRRDLRAEVQTFLASNGPATASEIALGIRARRVDIVNALAAFPRVPSPVGASRRAAHYGPASILSRAVPSRQSGTTSQTARILAVLRDGRPHTTAEIHAVAGTSRLNSRASELRGRGFVIACEHVPGAPAGPHAQTYQLLATPDGPLGESESLPILPSGDSDSPSDTLSLFEVA